MLLHTDTGNHCQGNSEATKVKVLTTAEVTRQSRNNNNHNIECYQFGGNEQWLWVFVRSLRETSTARASRPTLVDHLVAMSNVEQQAEITPCSI